MRFTTKLLPSRSGNLGVLTLNHPKALHALTLDMIHCLQDVLGEWTRDPTMQCILLKSSGDSKRPAFCAGGNVKAVWQVGQEYHHQAKTAATEEPANFFYQEYQVNHAIATTDIPIVSLWDGVVMGGGVGLSIHGKYRVATERSMFAMPETAIGLFPDVGSLYWMPRLLSRPVANYLAMTGQRLQATDLVHAGLATHYVPSEQILELERALTEATAVDAPATDTDVVASVLTSFHETIPTQDCFLVEHNDILAEHFEEDSVEAILGNLEQAEDSGFCSETLKTLRKVSPTSLKVTLEGLKRGAQCETIGQDLQMEYRLAHSCSMHPDSDFFEGVRAVLVDKDQNPKWNPARVEDVTAEQVQAFFEPLGDEDWPIPPLSKL